MYSGSEFLFSGANCIAFQVLKYFDGNMPEKLLWERSITCNLEKPKLVRGLQIEPWNPFARKIRIFNSSKDSNQKGKMSFNLLFPRFRSSSILQFTNDRGIFPFIWLRLKSSVFKLLPFVNVAGNFPWKQLFLIFNTERELLKLPKQWGIWPINLLLDRSRIWRAFSMQIIEGILPVRLLFEAKKIICEQWRSWKQSLQHVGTQV